MGQTRGLGQAERGMERGGWGVGRWGERWGMEPDGRERRANCRKHGPDDGERGLYNRKQGLDDGG